ncbi:helical backbone metal receptor [Mesonia sp. MT50]|uniref:Helical backbone metal receptor n=1 Tax=Mesonia profundi TaxID=3070998 RepID=A0ABU1A4Q9_9FLAO|nr:helical backbone metal receptor [Mesonia profundi]MDQ7918584.1 helical backbone metal receptor [Mesonia profundi]
MPLFKDQLLREIHLEKTPQRIISLVPSQTELLIDLGLEKKVLGITKFCVHPTHLRSEKEIVGGTKSVYLDKIEALNPDIILCNKEENTAEMVEELEKIAPVHVSDINTLEESYALIEQYGELFQVEKKASGLITSIQQEHRNFQKRIANKSVKKVAYFIWKDPYMVAGGDTFIDYLLQENKFKNVFHKTARYPEVELHNLPDLDYLLLSSEPFPFSEKHSKYFEEYVPKEKIKFVDGEYFSWYGSRLEKAFSYFSKWHETEN